jgi:hypothetical protein
MANLGKFRGLSATANTTFASGVFTLSRHYQQVKQNLWPFPVFGPIDYLIVGGGGPGGPTNNAGGDILVHSGGGGGGQVREFLAQYLLSKGSFPVVVGTGGTAPAQTNTSGITPGGDSSFNGITSTGGGQGANPPSTAAGGGGDFNVAAGLRGGGAFYFRSQSGFPKVLARNAAGSGGSSAYGTTTTGDTIGAGGGGGSASATGTYIGGDGVTSVITGLGYGGGGNAAQRVNLPAVGYFGTPQYGTNLTFGGGGWLYSYDSSVSYDPRPNSGGGGRGLIGGSNIAGIPGAAGIVVIRYPTGAISATGGTITTSGGNTIHTFTTSGTFTVL